MDRTTKNTRQARQGENRGRIYILGISMILIVCAFGSVYGFTMMFAAHQ